MLVEVGGCDGGVYFGEVVVDDDDVGFDGLGVYGGFFGRGDDVV